MVALELSGLAVLVFASIATDNSSALASGESSLPLNEAKYRREYSSRLGSQAEVTVGASAGSTNVRNNFKGKWR